MESGADPLAIRFGTDGWRATIADGFTFENVRRCTAGLSRQLLNAGVAERGVVVGYDTRFGSDRFAHAAALVLAQHGIPSFLVDRPTPTPMVSYAIVEREAAGGIIITASHNPPTDNGFKLRSEYGGASDPETLREVESLIPDAASGVSGSGAEEDLVEIFDAAPAYIDHLGDLVDLDRLRASGLHVVADAMWGAGAGWLPHLLAGDGTKVRELHGERNPLFPGMDRPEPIPPNLDALQTEVARTKADVGLATDGDADRVGLVDETGRFVTQLQVYGLIALYLLEVRGWRGPIVKTLSTTVMLDKLGELYGVPVYETGVGFKFVAPKMLEVDAMVGGEESGGFAFRGHLPERDGILAGLFLLDYMVEADKRPTDLIAGLYELVGPHHYDRIDTVLLPGQREKATARLEGSRPQMLADRRVERISTMDGYKFQLEGGPWLLIRFSGTEPKLRVYAEAGSPAEVGALLEEGRSLAGLEG